MSTTVPLKTAPAANRAPAAAAAFRALRRGGPGDTTAGRECPRGVSGRSAAWGPRPSLRNRAATEIIVLGP
ncbi:hypothetical protein GCM10009610_55520 [Pseudonocardia xinjiangensis]